MVWLVVAEAAVDPDRERLVEVVRMSATACRGERFECLGLRHRGVGLVPREVDCVHLGGTVWERSLLMEIARLARSFY